jgi:hypothetical protein
VHSPPFGTGVLVAVAVAVTVRVVVGVAVGVVVGVAVGVLVGVAVGVVVGVVVGVLVGAHEPSVWQKLSGTNCPVVHSAAVVNPHPSENWQHPAGTQAHPEAVDRQSVKAIPMHSPDPHCDNDESQGVVPAEAGAAPNPAAVSASIAVAETTRVHCRTVMSTLLGFQSHLATA